MGMISKRAGKTNLRRRYKGYTSGPGGLKCPCCGAILNASRIIRRKEKRKLRNLKRLYAGKQPNDVV